MDEAAKKALAREKAARLEAERLLEKMSRELYAKNSELEEVNESLQRNQQTLIQQEKMASVGLLSSGIAHEINTPLGYSLSNLSVLNEYVAEIKALFQQFSEQSDREAILALLKTDEVQNIFSDMPDLILETTEGLQQVKQIVSDLRGFARSGGSDPAPAQINDAIRSTLNVLKGQLRHNYQVEADLGELPEIDCHIDKLNQVFANIILNAAQAMPDGGELKVTTRLVGEHIVIEISDSGPGIPEDIINQVFSPFFTTKPVGEGTGLGLAICYVIVTDEHDGALGVSNRENGGATFTITLPV